MRTLTLTLRDSTGRLEVSETTGCPTDYQPSGPYLREILSDLMHRLDVVERDGPWKQDQDGTRDMQVVKNSLQPAPNP